MKTLDVAFTQYGVKEIRGAEDNPEIMKYFHDLGFTSNDFKDETAWCSAFANWVCKMCGKSYTKKLNARSWLDVGYRVQAPQPGDIVVFWRGSVDSWKGHVAFFINQDDDNIYVLGGNQSNQVCISSYPKSRLLQYRRV